MPAWRPDDDPPPSQSLTPEAAPRAAAKPQPPAMAEPLQPEVVRPRLPASSAKSSTIREGRERLAAEGDAMAAAILNMAGLGDPERAASDEAVRGQMLRYASDIAGLPAPQVSVQVQVAMSPEEAFGALSRLLGESDE